MVNWNRLSRFSQNRNKRRSLRRGGAPREGVEDEEAVKDQRPTGRDGSLCLGLTNEKDCVGTPVMRKTCQWHKEYVDAKRKKHPARCQRKANTSVFSEQGHEDISKFSREAQARFKKDGDLAINDYEDPEESDDVDSDEEGEMIEMVNLGDETPPVPRGQPSPQPSPQLRREPPPKVSKVSKRQPTPAQLRRAQAKKSGEKYVPVMSRNAPMGCVQKEYPRVSAKGKSFVSHRCVDSKDPKVNDKVNCMVNPETNKCKKVERA